MMLKYYIYYHNTALQKELKKWQRSFFTFSMILVLFPPDVIGCITKQPLDKRGKNARYPLDGKLRGHHSRSGRREEDIQDRDMLC
jgi:hypothetical protein